MNRKTPKRSRYLGAAVIGGFEKAVSKKVKEFGINQRGGSLSGDVIASVCALSLDRRIFPDI
jgi:hypothetical protein